MVALLLIAALASPPAVPVRGLYVWDPVDDPTRLLKTCSRAGVSRLYLRTVPGVNDDELLRGLLRRAREPWALPPEKRSWSATAWTRTWPARAPRGSGRSGRIEDLRDLAALLA